MNPMLLSQSLDLKRSELREKMNELNQQDEPSAEDVKQLHAMTKEMQQLEVRYRAAVLTEAKNGEAPKPTEEQQDVRPDAECREYLGLVNRLELRSYMTAIMQGHQVSGAEQELQQHFNLAADFIPWETIAPRHVPLETRADVPTPAPSTVQAAQQQILNRVFAMSSAEYLGVESPMVPVGEALYPVLTSGTTLSMQAKDGEQESTAGAFTPFNISPTRLTGKFTWRVEDAAVLAGMEEALRRDLSMAAADLRDVQILKGNGTAPNVNGFQNELAAPTDTSAETTFVNYATAAAAGLDGIYAGDFAGLRHLVNPDVARHMASKFIASGSGFASAGSAWEYVRSMAGGLKASANMKNTASNKADALTFRAERGMGSAVAPTWQGLQMIRDQVTGADQGHVHLTLIMLWGFKVIREAAYRQWRAQVAA